MGSIGSNQPGKDPTAIRSAMATVIGGEQHEVTELPQLQTRFAHTTEATSDVGSSALTTSASVIESKPSGMEGMKVNLVHKSDLPLHKKILKALKNFFIAIYASFATLGNSHDRSWRSHEKYHYLSQQTLQGLETLASLESESRSCIDKLLGESLDRPNRKTASLDVCKYHLQQALYALKSAGEEPSDGFDCRSAHKLFLTHLRSAMATDSYTEACKPECNDGDAVRFAGLANDICLAMYTECRMAGFHQSMLEHVTSGDIREDKSEAFTFPKTHVNVDGFSIDPLEQFTTDTSDDSATGTSDLDSDSDSGLNFARMHGQTRPSEAAMEAMGGSESALDNHNLEALTSFSYEMHSIHPYFEKIQAAPDRVKINPTEKLFQNARGSLPGGRFDPNMQGNPPNRKADITRRDGKVIGNLRLATPTKGSEITPEFLGYLRALRARKQKHTYINLQQNSGGNKGENQRSALLEKLAKEEGFEDVLTVVTLDKNSSFYHQKGEFKSLNDSSKFMKTFQDRIKGDKTGFSLPSLYKSGEKGEEFDKKIDEILKGIHKNFFDSHSELTVEQRHNFIELAYTMIIDYIVTDTDADFYNTSCKDCIDRGGGANALMLYTLSAFAALDAPKGEKVNENAISTEQLIAQTYMDAMWSRKREIIEERLERALTPVEVMMEKPSGLEWMKGIMSFKSAEIEVLDQPIKRTSPAPENPQPAQA